MYLMFRTTSERERTFVFLLCWSYKERTDYSKIIQSPDLIECTTWSTASRMRKEIDYVRYYILIVVLSWEDADHINESNEMT